MEQPAALTQFLRALGEVYEYHVMFGLLCDIAREGACRIPEPKLVEILRRHTPERHLSKYYAEGWKAFSSRILPEKISKLDAVSPNNLLIVALVALFEAFLTNLRVERDYPWPRQTRDGKKLAKEERYPSYGPLRLVYNEFSTDLKGSGWSREDLDELVWKRHCIVHRGARVDDDYLGKLTASPRLGPHRPCLPPDGDVWRVLRLRAETLCVGDAELLFHLDQLHRVAVFLDATCVGPPADAAP